MTRRHRRSRRGARTVMGLLLVGALAVGGVALARSSLFGITGIEVVGARSPEAIVSASALRVGQNVLSVDADAARDRIEALPNISTARVERDGLQVRITVKERRPALEVRSAHRRWFVDADGRPIDVGDERVRVPVLRVPSLRGGTPDVRAVDDVLALVRALPATLERRLTALEAIDGAAAMRLGSMLVIIGDGEDVERKLDALASVEARARAEGRRIARVDLRAPDRPAVTFA